MRADQVRGHERPQRVGAARRHHAAEPVGPMRLVAELLAPRPQPPRRLVQRVLVGEAHRAVHLMRDRGAGAGRLADPVFWRSRPRPRSSRCRRRAWRSPRTAPSAAAPAAATSPARLREIVLHRLELGDRPAELYPVQRPLHRLVEDVFERAGHLLRPHRGAELHDAEPCRDRRRRQPRSALAPSNDTVSRGSPARLVPWLIARPRGRHQRHRRGAVLLSEHDDMLGVARERHLTRAAAQVSVGQLDMAVGMDRGDRHRAGGRLDPGLREQPAGHQASRRAAPARWPGRRRARPRTRRAVRRRRRRACRAPRSGSDRIPRARPTALSAKCPPRRH